MAFFLNLLLFAVFTLLSSLLRPKPKIENAKPAGLGDFRFPTATEGRVVPVIWGTVRISGPNVVWYGDYQQQAITEKVKTGLFSSTRVVVGYRYYFGLQMALCHGTIDKLSRVWVGDKLVWSTDVLSGGEFEIDEPTLYGGNKLGNGGLQARMQLFAGENNQAASAYLSNFQQVGGATSAYRGFAYVTNSNTAHSKTRRKPAYIGNNTSPQAWAFEIQRVSPLISGGAPGDELVNGQDANPAYVLYEILTNANWGLGFDASEIDLSSFNAAAGTLRTEGNGFSFVLDTVQEIVEIIRIVEEQIDGVLFFDPRTLKWRILLARGGYTVSTLPALNPDNVIEFVGFTRSTWADTTNQIRIEYEDSSDTFKSTYAIAQDTANVQLQGEQITGQFRYPGVKNGTLAQSIAWRELRALSRPLAKVQAVCTRLIADPIPTQVYRVTDPDLGITDLPMRVTKINFDDLSSGRIVLDLTEDVFSFGVGRFNPTPNTSWSPPQATLVPYPADEQLAFEAPRGFVVRDTNSLPTDTKIWAGARLQQGEPEFTINYRKGTGSPSGSFVEGGESVAFFLIGELAGTLTKFSAVPLPNLTITPDPDTVADVVAALPAAASVAGAGTDLTNLIYIDSGGGEFAIVQGGAVNVSGNINLLATYRGVLDTTQKEHPAGTKVYFIGVGGNLTDDVLDPTVNPVVGVKLLPNTTSGALDIASATEIVFTLTNRVRQPYPPSRMSINLAVFPSSVSLEGSGSPVDFEAVGMAISIVRRSYETVNEIDALTIDAATIFPIVYPLLQDSRHTWTVVNNPATSPTTLATIDMADLASASVLRNDILIATGGVIPTQLEFRIAARHTVDAVTYNSRQNLIHRFNVTSVLSGTHNFGILDTDIAGTAITISSTGTYIIAMTRTLDAAVEYRIGAGAWTTALAAGSALAFLAFTAGDQVQIRHRSSTPGIKQMVQLLNISAIPIGYAVLIT